MYGVIVSIHDLLVSKHLTSVICSMLGEALNSIGTYQGIFASEVVAVIARISAQKFSSLGIYSTSTILNLVIIYLEHLRYCSIFSSFV